MATAPRFKVGDLVWAKMRGFPHWPAQVAKSPCVGSVKYNVFFFGTHEHAFVRPSDVCSYSENAKNYARDRKLTGFQRALEEIEDAAAKKRSKRNVKRDTSQGSQRQTQRTRIPNRMISSEDFVVPQPKRKSESQRSDGETPSTGPPEPPLRNADPMPSTERTRSNYSYSERFGVDLSDIESTYPHALKNNPLYGLPVFESEHSEDDLRSPGGRKRLLTRSKIIDDLFTLNIKPPRERTSSCNSSSERTRLISGFSDTFEDLEHLTPNTLFAALDELSEESDRPGSPEAPTGMPVEIKNCYSCDSLCTIYKRKWRECNRWNGVVNNTHKQNAPHPLSFGWTRPHYLEDIPVSDLSDKGDGSMKKGNDSCDNFFTTEPMADAQISLIKQELELESSSLLSPVDTTSSTMTFSQRNTQTTASPSVVHSSYQSVPSMDTSTIKLSPRPHVIQVPDIKPESISPTVKMEQYEPQKRTSRQGTRSRAKVEKTPPVTSNGVRYCYFCPGQVRPQMCGGNKHRWRCVDKKCRKWYGWVKSSDEIPRDLGKKGRWKDLVIRVQSSQNEFEDRLASDMIQKNGETEEGGEDDRTRAKRRYRRCKPHPWRDVSPLTVKESYYEPSCMEQRPRWWIQERKKAEFSPDREFGTELLDAAASFRLTANSLLTVANTKTDEYGSVNGKTLTDPQYCRLIGALDLLMDSLMASMAPLLTVAKRIPGLELPEDTLQKVWSATSLHTPMF